jgi:hypothetical protein
MLKVVIAAVYMLTVFHEDTKGSPEKSAQLNAVAAAVAEFARSPDEVAFLLAWAKHETNLSLRIHAGQCRAWECDRGKARGPWQAHRNGMPLERWDRMHGVENTRAQAEHAARMARWALRQCPDDRIRGAFRVLGGRACWQPLKGDELRVADFQKMRGRL